MTVSAERSSLVRIGHRKMGRAGPGREFVAKTATNRQVSFSAVAFKMSGRSRSVRHARPDSRTRRRSVAAPVPDLETSTLVCTRVRPTYGEETDCVVHMEDNVTVIQNPLTKTKYTFRYDHCLWSYDHCESFISQDRLYTVIGKQVLDDSFKGFNVTLLAYGQTGSGKSYTLFGPPEVRRPDPIEMGVVPRLGKDLFSRIRASRREDTEWIVQMTATEIYNDSVTDLLNPAAGSSGSGRDRDADSAGPKGGAFGMGSSGSRKDTRSPGLKIREHAVKGPYVEGLKVVTVRSGKHLMSLLIRALGARQVRSTRHNDFSSRSHFIIQWTLTRIKNVSKSRELRGERSCLISIVDLAGSSRDQGDLRAGGQTAVERNQINLSLTCLGKVIDKLTANVKRRRSRSVAMMQAGAPAAPSEGSDRGSLAPAAVAPTPKPSTIPSAAMEYVPYRDNVLTWLLKEALSGNCKTMLIATLSPSSTCLEETLSTLRFADRVKRIKTHAKINEDANPMILIEELRSELFSLQLRSQDFENEKETLRTEIDDLRGKHLVEESELEALRASHAEETERIKGAYKMKIGELTGNLGMLRGSIEQLQSRKKSRDLDYQSKVEELDQVRSELDETSRSFRDLVQEKDDQIAALQNAFDSRVTSLEDQLKDSRDSISRLEDGMQEGDLRNKAALAEADQRLKEANDLRNAIVADRDSEIADLRGDVEGLEDRIASGDEIRKDLRDRIESLQKQLEEDGSSLVDLREEKKGLMMKKVSLENERDLLKDAVKNLQDRVRDSSVALDEMKAEKQTDIDRLETELMKTRNEFEGMMADLGQEKDELERKLKDELLAEREARDAEKARLMKERASDLDRQKRRYDARIDEITSEKDEGMRDMQQRLVDLRKEHGDEMESLRKQASDAEAEVSRRKQARIDALQDQFRALKERHGTEMDTLSTKLKDQVAHLEDLLTSALTEKEGLSIEFENSRADWRKKEADLAVARDSAVKKAVDEQRALFDEERSQLRKDLDLARRDLSLQLEKAKVDLEAAQQGERMKLSALAAEYDRQKERLQSEHDDDLRRLGMENERGIKLLGMKHENEIARLNQQIGDYQDDLEKRAAEMEDLRLKMEAEIEDLRQENGLLLDKIREWIRIQRLSTSAAFSNLSGIVEGLDDDEDSGDL